MTKPKCKRCNKEDAIVHPTYGIIPGKNCQKKYTEKSRSIRERTPEFYNLSKQDRIQRQRDTHGADLLQPTFEKGLPNRDFAKKYPDVAENFYGKEALAKL